MNQKNETLSEAHSPEATLIIFPHEVFEVRNKEKFCLSLWKRRVYFSPNEKTEQLLIDDYPRSKGECAKRYLTVRVFLLEFLSKIIQTIRR